MTVALTRSPVAGAVDLLEPIDLLELESRAELSQRRDRKYLVDPADLSGIIAEVGPDLRALEIGSERSFSYESVYFDTPDYASYLATAHRRPRRFKVRTRSYLDSQLCKLEVKERRRDGMNIKRRIPHPYQERATLTETAREYVDALVGDALETAELRAVSGVIYDRSTLVDPRVWSRITIDSGLTVAVPGGDTSRFDGFIIVETKSVRGPAAFDKALWHHGYRPTQMSKYCTLLATIDPSRPANHWNRTLRRHFDWQPQR